MDHLTSTIQVLAIVAALIVLRIVVQRVRQRPAGGGVLKALWPFTIPPLITGGPGFIAWAASFYALRDPSAPRYIALLAWAGGVMLAIGLAAMLGMLTRQQREILDLQKRITGELDNKG